MNITTSTNIEAKVVTEEIAVLFNKFLHEKFHHAPLGLEAHFDVFIIFEFEVINAIFTYFT